MFREQRSWQTQRRQDYQIYVFVYLASPESGETTRRITLGVKSRPRPEAFNTPEGEELFEEAIQAVNDAAKRAEDAGKEATAAAGEARESASLAGKYLTDTQVLAEQVEINADAVAQGKEEAARLLTQTQEAASNAALSAETAKQSETVAKQAQTAAETAEDAARQYAEETEADRQEVAESKQSVEQMQSNVARMQADVQADKEAVEQTVSEFGQTAQNALTAIGQAQNTAVSAVQAEGQKQAMAVQETGVQAVNEVDTAKTAAVGVVTAEGDVQVVRIQEAAAEIVADREQIQQNKTNIATLIDKTNTLAPGIVLDAKGGAIAVSNASEQPLVGLKVYGKSEQFKTTGAQLLPEQAVSNYFISLNGDIVGKNNSDYSKIIQNTENTTYYIFRKNVGTRFRAAYVDAIPTGNTPCTGVVDDTKDNISITVPAGKVLIINMEDTKAFDGLMVQKTRDRLPYEPYTGGKPSPSPEYPQEIESAGDKGNLNVMVRGKNIFPGPEQPKTVEQNGLTFSYKDGMYTLTGTSNENTWFNIYPVIDKTTSISPTHNGNAICSDGKIAVVNGLKNKLCNIAFREVDNKNSTTVITASNNKKMLQHNASGVFIYAPPGSYSDTFTLMITGENQTEDYEPYHTPQTLTLSTPNGLPGIPVSSGGNYTDENGQQWVCDEIDLERGKYVQRIETRILDGTEAWKHRITNSGNNNFQILINDRLSSTIHRSFCNYLPYKNFIWDDNIVNLPKIYSYCLEITASFPPESEFKSVEIWNSWLKEKGDFKFQYVLATPIERDLTPEEIAAYKALHTYSGTTIVTNDSGAGMSLTYTVDTKKYIDEKIAAISAAMIGG